MLEEFKCEYAYNENLPICEILDRVINKILDES